MDNEGYIDLSELGVGPCRNTLEDRIRGIIKRFGPQEFNPRHVYAVLSSENADQKRLPHRERVSGILINLVKKKELTLILRGKGSEPSVYATTTINEAPPETKCAKCAEMYKCLKYLRRNAGSLTAPDIVMRIDKTFANYLRD